MVDSAAQPEVSGSSSRDDAAPFWLLIALLLLLFAVTTLGWLVSQRMGTRRAEAALAADPRLTFLEKAARERPDDLGVRRQLAQLYRQSGRDRDALREYKGILTKYPDDAGALYGAGTLYLADGDAKLGERSLLTVLEIDPSHPYAAIALAEHYSATQRVEKVVGVVKPAADAHPDIADLQYLTALGYEETGEKKSAVEYYRRALRFVPEMREAREALDRLGAGR